ncbi:NAD-dependent epimerase/dehydratase family protein [Micromonospora inyonensis]|uniref:dTDP-D-glucose 4,6-dehydratase n=1 Tax=Micromonospora inyonensis TaxID=47866 RepID=A0A1C6RLI6_9ACTN|nr:NAD-dependent epimerase/dehydratase [Micromonospora inyonensis]SCL18020.1 dTDP-D-glucose 4,6-dehydratase [Micromonospora inyonensis]
MPAETEALTRYFGGQEVLVTGGFGFLGGHLTRWLTELGARVTVFDADCRPTRPSLLAELPAGPDVLRVREGDVTRYQELEAVLLDRPYQSVFHLAAYSMIEKAAEHPINAIATNTMGTVNLLEVLRRHRSARPEAVIVSSTDKVYGELEGDRYTEQSPLRGVGIYDAAKLGADVLTQSYNQSFGISTVVLRLCNLLGPHDYNHQYRLVPRSLSYVFDRSGPRPPELYFDSIQHERDYLYIDDAVRALLLAASQPACRGDVFNVPGCASLRTPEVMHQLVQVAAEHESTFDADRAATILDNGFRVTVRDGITGATAINRQRVDGTKLTERVNFRPATNFGTALTAAVEFARRRHYRPAPAKVGTA